jgi:uncharacterized coiled-coil DUF342 family protein
MGGAQANINKIKAETLALEGQRQEAQKGKNKLKEAVSALKNQRNEIQSNLKRMYGGLDQINGAINSIKSHPLGPDHPQVAEQLGKLRAQREQIIGQISYLKKGMKDIGNRINEYSGKLESLGQNIEMMGSAVSARKSALQKIAGQMAAQISLNSNREVGRKKG